MYCRNKLLNYESRIVSLIYVHITEKDIPVDCDHRRISRTSSFKSEGEHLSPTGYLWLMLKRVI